MVNGALKSKCIEVQKIVNMDIVLTIMGPSIKNVPT